MTTKFKLMPFPPTEEIIAAADDTIPWSRGTESYKGFPSPEEIYQAMWDTAPEPPAEGETPETNAHIAMLEAIPDGEADTYDCWLLTIEFAKRLERELNALRSKLTKGDV
jgi:hypothetical protein